MRASRGTSGKRFDDDPGIELLRSMKLPPREETPERDWKFFDQEERKGLDPMYTMPNVDGKHGADR